MTFAIYLTEEALEEEAEAFLFYEKQQLGLGEKFLKEVESTLYKISENPTHYSFIDETKTIRDIVLSTFPYVIIFKVNHDKIEVYHIHHTSKSK